MQKSGPFIGNGLSELRNALSAPGDQLYQQLTDLIVALEEAGGGDRDRDVSTHVEKSKSNFVVGAIAANRNGIMASYSLMDTSGPSRKKIRRKRRRRRSATLPITNLGIFSNGAGGCGNNSVSHPSATELCVSHSPIHGTSDSSFDWRTTKNLLMDMSDSETERLITKASPTVKNTMVHSRSGGDFIPFRAPNKQPPESTMLLPILMSAPVESDSFTETLTPARHSHQRRKRLIKRMAVDQPNGEIDQLGDNRRRHTPSMDVDGSPNISRSVFSGYGAASGQKSGGSYSEHSIEFDAGSCLSASDVDDDNSSDDGRQGDDELSDWCFECSVNGTEAHGDEYMGVPNLKQSMRMPNSSNTLNIESSDTDMSQSSFSQTSRRFVSKNGASLCGALNRRIVQFLHDPNETELSLGELRKRERKEALKLAVFYNLDIRRATTLGCRYHILCKTKYSRWVD